MKAPLANLFRRAYKAEMAQRRKRIRRDSLGRRTDRVKKREEEAMSRLQLSGLTPKEIATSLGRKEETVKRHLASKSMEKTAQQDEMARAVTRELIPEIKKLAKTLQWLIYVPEPELPLLDDETDARVTEAMMKGNMSPYLKVVRTMNIPWWCADPSIHVYLALSPAQEALFDRFLSLPTSQKFKATLNEWGRGTNRYIDLVRLGGDTEQIEAAYRDAKQAQEEAHSELWNAVVALHWGS